MDKKYKNITMTFSDFEAKEMGQKLTPRRRKKKNVVYGQEVKHVKNQLGGNR